LNAFVFVLRMQSYSHAFCQCHLLVQQAFHIFGSLKRHERCIRRNGAGATKKRPNQCRRQGPRREDGGAASSVVDAGHAGCRAMRRIAPRRECSALSRTRPRLNPNVPESHEQEAHYDLRPDCGRGSICRRAHKPPDEDDAYRRAHQAAG
jgi:hypothetical protein